ncbi:lytic transglycosylase domain-containing protein [Flavobacterium sp. H122]|uniref:lytic transglycosylase domain-containing protein n=1 Tax=Flavobacterium sp. H122 TaxID=2529860 RepID=UPI0010AB3F1B|nr:lytic transglycosylase domain-containing protein [Flavobacterium sp. H122]
MKKVAVLLVVGFLGIAFLSATKNETRYFPDKIDFCGEETPLNIPDVRERLDRELVVNQHLHGSTIMIIKRANRFFPVIEPILAKNNVPDDFKYLAVIESSLTNATSPSGAKGFWQFMPLTAKEKGMEVNDIVDERYHLEKSTQMACEYLIKAKEKFGSWTMAAASYNGGMAGLQKAVDQQMETNYYDLLLTDETFRYVFRILALKQIMQNKQLYGFELKVDELYQPLSIRKIEVDSSISDLAKFAKIQGVNYKELKLYNPWLRDKKLDNPTKKKYIFDLPVK